MPPFCNYERNYRVIMTIIFATVAKVSSSPWSNGDLGQLRFRSIFFICRNINHEWIMMHQVLIVPERYSWVLCLDWLKKDFLWTPLGLSLLLVSSLHAYHTHCRAILSDLSRHPRPYSWLMLKHPVLFLFFMDIVYFDFSTISKVQLIGLSMNSLTKMAPNLSFALSRAKLDLYISRTTGATGTWVYHSVA